MNVSSGLGFNGYDDQGRARWDLVDNADIWKIEVPTVFLYYLLTECIQCRFDC